MPTIWKALVLASWAVIVVLVVMVCRLNTHGSDLTKWAGDITNSPVTLSTVKADRPSWSFSEWADSLWVRHTQLLYRVQALDRAVTDDFFPPPPPPPDW